MFMTHFEFSDFLLLDVSAGLLFSVLITGVLTDAIKDATGRPRPDFFWRCFPDGVDVCNFNLYSCKTSTFSIGWFVPKHFFSKKTSIIYWFITIKRLEYDNKLRNLVQNNYFWMGPNTKRPTLKDLIKDSHPIRNMYFETLDVLQTNYKSAKT